MGNAPGLYDKAVHEVSIKNQIKWRNNIGEPSAVSFFILIPLLWLWLCVCVVVCVCVCVCVCAAVRFVQRDERRYYEALLNYSREHYVVSE